MRPEWKHPGINKVKTYTFSVWRNSFVIVGFVDHWQSDFGSHWYEQLPSKLKQNRYRPEYYLEYFCCWNSEITWSTTWLLMTCFLASPSRQQHWLYTTDKANVSCQDWLQPTMPFPSVLANVRKMWYTFLFSKNNSAGQRLNNFAQCGHVLS